MCQKYLSSRGKLYFYGAKMYLKVKFWVLKIPDGIATVGQLPNQLPKATNQKPRTKIQSPYISYQKPRTNSVTVIGPFWGPYRRFLSDLQVWDLGSATLEPSDSKSAHATTHAFAHVWSRTHHKTNAFWPPHSLGQTRPLTRPGTGGAYEAPDGLESRWTL
jgi:hypothetical protein